jgi:heterodisulfide reductase subunit A-like polyferredoxin
MLYEKKGRYIVEFSDIPSPRQHQIEIEVDERRNSYKEVELGFNEDRAVLEAKRCLSCRRCLGCALCWAECKPEAIIFEMQDEVFDLEADEIIISPGVERPVERIDKRFGFGKLSNVMTDLQLERMLSDSGPTAGLIIRPFDGEVPKSIAFVQSYPSAPPQMHHAALCLGVNEAILARHKLPQADIQVFVSNSESFFKEHDAELKDLNGVSIKESSVIGVEELEDRGLKLTLESDGTQEAKSFDLVVLLTQPQISKDVKDLSKQLGLSLAYASFIEEEGKGLISTRK